MEVPLLSKYMSITGDINICRICAENSELLISIIDDTGLQLNICKKIESCLSIKIDSSDPLPHSICESCNKKLNICHEFYEIAKAADVKLRKEYGITLDGTETISKEDINSGCSNVKQNELSTSIFEMKSNLLTDSAESTEKDDHDGMEDCIVEDSNSIVNSDSELQIQGSQEITTEIVVENNKLLDGNLIPENVDNVKSMEDKNTDVSSTSSERDSDEYSKQDQNCYICPICSKSCKSSGGLDVHLSTHSNTASYLCDLCGKKFKHCNTMKCHKRTHLVESLKKRHQCNVCDKRFRSKFHLSEHMNTHNDVRPYTCPKCSSRFHQRITLRQHARTHLPENDKFPCHICTSRFNRRSNLSQHIRRVHCEIRSYKCRLCLEEYLTLGELLSHRSTHQYSKSSKEIVKETKDEEEKKYQCVVCSKVFLNEGLHKIHERIHKETNCDVCSKLCANKASLLNHKKTCHSDEPTYRCQYCGKGYRNRQLHVNHERTHIGVKPYKCTVCDKAFTGVGHLSQHMLTHSTARNFECTYCLKRFQRRATLAVHVRTHTGLKPYVCEICNHRAAQKNDIVKHKRTHKKVEQLNDVDKGDRASLNEQLLCDVCKAVFNSNDELVRHKLSHDIVGMPVVFTVQNSDVLSSITEIISDECQSFITLSTIQTS